jgi:colicin import membrane protein
MLEIIKKHPRYALGALLVHLFFLGLFGFTFHFKSEQRAATTQRAQTVKVTTVDQKLVQKELQAFKARDDKARRQREELARKRKAEEKRLAKLRAQRLAEQKRRLAEQKKEQQRIALAKQREKLLKQKQAAEQKRLKELARKRREEEERRLQAQNEQAFKKQLEAEAKQMQQQQQIAAQRRAALKAKQTKIDKYMNLIENKIYQNWVMPPSTNKGLVCVLQVTLIPTGDVVNIELSKSSGDPVYDKSVIAAVRRASPLPVPPAEDGLFDVFRNLTLPVRADKKT